MELPIGKLRVLQFITSKENLPPRLIPENSPGIITLDEIPSGGIPPAPPAPPNPPPLMANLPPPPMLSPEEKHAANERNRLEREHKGRLQLAGYYNEGSELSQSDFKNLITQMDSDRKILKQLSAHVEANEEIKGIVAELERKINDAEAKINKNKRLVYTSDIKTLKNKFAEHFTSDEMRLILGAYTTTFSEENWQADLPASFKPYADLFAECREFYLSSSEKELVEEHALTYKDLFEKTQGAYGTAVIEVFAHRQANNLPGPLHEARPYKPIGKIARGRMAQNPSTPVDKGQLLEGIRGGVTLKTRAPIKPSAESQAGLLSDIKAGPRLRKTPLGQPVAADAAANPAEGLAAKLAPRGGSGVSEAKRQTEILNNLETKAMAYLTSTQEEFLTINERLEELNRRIIGLSNNEDIARLNQDLNEVQTNLDLLAERRSFAQDFLNNNFLSTDAYSDAANHPFSKQKFNEGKSNLEAASEYADKFLNLRQG